MRVMRAGRLRKRWTWVGAFGPELMLCVGAAQVGPGWQSWWAVWDRAAGRLHEHTRVGRRGMCVEPGRAHVAGVLDLQVDAGDPVEVTCPDGPAHTWTRKQAGVRARGTVRLDGVVRPVDLLAVVDESAGYHPRHTAWRWSAGVGEAADGRAVAWNLVTGINDPAEGSERAVWVDGKPREVGPVQFAPDLSAVGFTEGGELRFTAEATRERDDNLLLFRSRYAQPFGTFSGSLPRGVEIAEAFGVMERHEARW
jgi:Protein of unknown function (DUF2804)